MTCVRLSIILLISWQECSLMIALDIKLIWIFLFMCGWYREILKDLLQNMRIRNLYFVCTQHKIFPSLSIDSPFECNHWY